MENLNVHVSKHVFYHNKHYASLIKVARALIKNAFNIIVHFTFYKSVLDHKVFERCDYYYLITEIQSTIKTVLCYKF